MAGVSVLPPPPPPGENSLKCAAEDGADGLESWVRPSICTANELMAWFPCSWHLLLESQWMGPVGKRPSPGAGPT